jgi:hypothetical protein
MLPTRMGKDHMQLISLYPLLEENMWAYEIAMLCVRTRAPFQTFKLTDHCSHTFDINDMPPKQPQSLAFLISAL